MAYANAFDSTNYPTRPPATLPRGARAAWKDGDLLSEYPAASYSWKWVARLEAGTANASEISISGSASGSDVLFEAGTSTTTAWALGRYRWDLVVTRTSDSEPVTVAHGVVEVTPATDHDTGDRRSHARRALEAIEATLEGRADSSVQSYTIAGRSVAHYSVEELLTMRRTYRREVYAETIAAAKSAGQHGAGLIRVSL